MNYNQPATQAIYVDTRRAFISLLMRSGLKTKAQRIWDQAMLYISQYHNDTDTVVLNAMELCTPVVECSRVRVAGTVIQVPKLLTPNQARARSVRWLIEGARRRNNSTYAHALAQEIMDAARGSGWATSQREEVHRTAEANRAFIRYQWWK